jgi:hypothetical protein
MAWNRPELRERIAPVLGQWKSAMRDAVREAVRDYRLDTDRLDAEEWISLIVAFNEGIILERLSGITEGHADLLEAIDRWLVARKR